MRIPSGRQPDILFRSHEHTGEDYGKRPAERSVEQLIDFGVIVLDKPPGPTSHKVTEMVGKLVGAKKAGHIGTLDPDVSGVLPILLNKSTRAAGYLMARDKEYVGIAEFHDNIDEPAIASLFSQFTGRITQVPPVRSAVARRPRQRQIHSFDILEVHGRSVLFKTKVEAGTYIRKLIDDVGRSAKTGAHLAELRRTAVSSIKESDAVTFHGIADAVWLWKKQNDATFIRKYVRNLEEVITNKKIWVSDSAIDPICSGAPLLIPGVVKCEKSIQEEDEVAVFSLKDEIVAFGTAQMGAEEIASAKSGIVVNTDRVMMERGTYPVWKKKDEHSQ